MFKVTKWHCDYCVKTLMNKRDMEEHEKVCIYNTASHSCATCARLKTKSMPHKTICGVMIEVPYCPEITDADRSPSNPHGFKRHCPAWCKK